MILELARLHETLNWFPESAPWIRLRRPRAALEDVMVLKSSLAYSAAGEYFYDRKLWEPKTYEEHPPKKKKRLRRLYAGYNLMVQDGCHYVLAATALRRDQPELWPICPMYGGANIVVTLLGDIPGWERRLDESGPSFDKQLAESAKRFINEPWLLPFETIDDDLQCAIDFINQATVPATDSEILASFDKDVKVTFAPKAGSPQPKEK
jgi:hypothetical protein